MEFKNPNTDVIKGKKLYIFDMDGTIYLGGIPFDFAKRFIKNLTIITYLLYHIYILKVKKNV